MMETEVVPEMSVVFNQLIWLNFLRRLYYC